MRKRIKRRKVAIDTLVGPNTKVHGNIHFDGGFHVDGYIKGDILCDSDSETLLSISEHACVEGNVNVANVILNGTVKGDVTARGQLELGSSAKVIGNVYYNLIEMAIGAEINGKLIHQPKDRPALLSNISDAVDNTVKLGIRD
ncbi:MAG: polymer-forming cytoskeletal protein [Gammaproteobacteria bacterium]